MSLSNIDKSIPVLFLSVKEGTPARGYWDQELLEIFFAAHPNTYDVSIDDVRDAVFETGVVVIPGAYQNDVIDTINTILSSFKRVTVIISSDEENNFDISALRHKNIRIFTTYPCEGMPEYVVGIPIGAPPHAYTTDVDVTNKDIDVLFAGQVNHESRRDLIDELKKMDNAVIYPSDRFAGGLDREEYIRLMARARVVPAPRGNISPDSFRLYEALELGAVPIAENQEFFSELFKVFGTDNQFPVIDNKNQWIGYIEDTLLGYPLLNIKACSAWALYKNMLFQKLLPVADNNVSVIVPVSYIPSHPNIDILVETIESIRFHFPHTYIYVTFDGLREEHMGNIDDYYLHILSFLRRYSRNPYVVPFVYAEHTHQVGMARDIVEKLPTDLVMYVEQDTPLVTDEPIDWESITQMLITGESDLVRLHFEAFIPDAHKYMMIGEPEHGFQKTVQWSQRPHIARTAYYKRILNNHFSPDAKCFIEDKMHGVVYNGYLLNKQHGWFEHRLHIYHPEGNIKRSYHTDGRAGSKKYDETQVF